MKPGLVLKTLDAVPELKSKLDGIGGIDNLYGGSGTTFQMGMPGGSGGSSAGSISMLMAGAAAPTNPAKLFEQLKGKADSNPVLVKRRLQQVVEGPESIDLLIRLAETASYQDPELSSLALEAAQPLLSQVEPLTKRVSTLQNLARVYRQTEGSVDKELLKDGFILADQLREDASGNNDRGMNWVRPQTTAADQLEAFLVAELSRDSFEDAIRYARSIEKGTFKLQCMVQIVQALRSSY